MYLSWLFLYLFLLSRKVPTLDCYSLYFFHDMILNNFVTIHDIIFSYNFYIVNQRILVNGKISVLPSASFSWTITRPKYLRPWQYYKHFFLKIYNLIYIKIDWLFTNQTNRTFLLKLNSYKLQYLYWDRQLINDCALHVILLLRGVTRNQYLQTVNKLVSFDWV